MSLAKGQCFGSYTIIRALGSGGMGEVYLAQHPRLPRHDALKVLRREVSTDRDYRSRFEREADLASTLWHPHIVRVHDRGDVEGQLWISMDYVDGHNAAELLAARYPAGMPPDAVAEILTAVASALDYAHRQGLLHRDVKPANIMLTEDDEEDDRRVLLADFGIARSVDDVSGLTSTNMTVGTVAYSAPEQLLGEEIDGRADQYALAASAYHLLTGRTLFPHSNPAVVISRHLNSEPPKLTSLSPVLALADTVLQKALDKDPSRRYVRCSDFARAFVEAVEQGASSGLSAGPTRPAPRSSLAYKPRPMTPPKPSAEARYARPRWMIPAAVSTVVLIAIAVTVLVLHPRSGNDSPAAQVDPTTTAMTTVELAPPTTTIPLPPLPTPPTFAATAIDSLMLSPSDAYRITDGQFAGYPTGVPEVISSSQGTSDNTFAINPPQCAGILFGAEQRVYADTGYASIRNQVMGKSTSTFDDRIEQTAAVFDTPDQAQAVFATSQTQWQKCAAGHPDPDPRYPNSPAPEYSVHHDRGYEQSSGWDMANVMSDGSILTIQMGSVDNLNGGSPVCQAAMGIKDNVVATTRTCFDARTNPYAPDPAQAGDYASKLLVAMLSRVRI